MASSADPWVREHSEAARLADDVASMVADRAALRQSGPEAMRHTSAICHKITILGTRLDTLEGMLARLPPKSILIDDVSSTRSVTNSSSIQGPGFCRPDSSLNLMLASFVARCASPADDPADGGEAARRLQKGMFSSSDSVLSSAGLYGDQICIETYMVQLQC
ncbi:Syntaxin-51 [Hordeum vulgare]|nr:Syntaxin-51 [Hordeum vulgare]